MNGTNSLNYLMSDMAKYLSSNKTREIDNNNNISNREENNEVDNNISAVDKEKLFKSFLMFMDNQQTNSNLPSNNAYINNQMTNSKELDLSVNESFPQNRNLEYMGKIGKERRQEKENEYENENKDVDNQRFNHLEEYEEPITFKSEGKEKFATQEEPPKVLNFEDIPIQPKAKNFYELLEKNLANDNGDMYSNDVNDKPKRVIPYKPRPRRSEMLNISQPTEVKKYKYYLQNYNKDFGKGTDEPPEEVKELEKEELIDKKSSKGRYNSKSKVERPQTASSKRSESQNKKTTAVKSNPMSNQSTANTFDGKKQIPNQKNKTNVNAGSIWDDLKEVNKVLNQNEDDDFLNAYTKPTVSNSNKNAVVNAKEDYEIKMPHVKPNIVKTHTKVNPLTEQVIQMKNSYNGNKVDKSISQFDNLNNEKSINVSNLNIEELTMQISQEDEDYRKDLKINTLNTINSTMNTQQKRPNNPRMNEFQSESEDDDDHRDIIKMYEEHKRSNNQMPQVKEEAITNNNQNANLYKKPEQQKIINKYFKPFIKDSKDNKEINSNLNNNVNSTDINTLVNEKIEELNKEIEKIKKENEKVAKLKTEYEKLAKKIGKEVEDFNQKKGKEIEDFEQWKEEEMKKIEKERKVHLRNTKLLQNMPNRKEREEIENLKEQVLKLQEEMKAKDQRNKLASERMKKQLDESNKKCEDLQKEIRFIEEMRVKNMVSAAPNNKSSQVASDNKKKTIPNSSQNTNAQNIQTNYSSNNLTGQITYNNNTNKSLKSSPSTNSNLKTSSESKPVGKSPFSHHKRANTSSKITTSCSPLKKGKEKENSSDENENDILNEEVDMNDYNSNPNIMRTYQNQTIQNSRTNLYPAEDNENEIIMNKVKVIKTKPNERQINTETFQSIKSAKNLPSYGSQATPSASSKGIQNEAKSTKAVSNFPSEHSEETYEMVFLEKYHSKTFRLLKQDFTEDGKIIKLYENMKKEIIFVSGVKKEIFEDGYQVTYFNNKDVKQVYPDGREVYMFSENKTLQFKFPDGLQVFKFESGQIEKHFADGTKVVNYVDGTIRNVYTDGYEETFFPDGSLQKVDKTGVVTIDYEDGLKDTIYPDGTKIREFTDGRVKKILPDGRVENYFK